VCEQKDCDQYFVSVLLMKNNSAGNEEAFQEFAVLFENSTKSMVLGLNKKAAESMSQAEMLESLKRALVASKSKEKGAHK